MSKVKLSRIQKNFLKELEAMKPSLRERTIQAMSNQAEGFTFDVALESMLDGQSLNEEDGTVNKFKTYTSQVTNTYKKYNAEADYGCAQVRAMVDARVAFTSGEGISISFDEPEKMKAHKELFKKMIKVNKLSGIRLFDINKTTEMTGYAILQVKANPTKDNRAPIPKVGLYHTDKGKAYYEPVYGDPVYPDTLKGFKKVVGSEKKDLTIKDAIYIRTGGYGCSIDTPTTKVGSVLTEAENYDKAIKDMREHNSKTSRITPDFETKSSSETKAIKKALVEGKWKIGKARIGTAKFDYKSPSNTAVVTMLKDEAVTNLKTMSGTTAVPVHWFGWVDQMSNKATAQELYAMVNNGTIMERAAIEAGLAELFIKMQQIYIDSGGKLITEVTEDFEIKLPLIDFGRFESMIKAYNMLYNDEIIGEDTYRAIVPGIDPLREKELIAKRNEAEKKAAEDRDKLVTTSEVTGDNIPEEDENGRR